MQDQPKIAVCLAAYNGISYVNDQLNSILLQSNVDVKVYVSIDLSSDGTNLWLDELSRRDSRVKLLPYGQSFGGAALNFFRLLREVDFADFDYISLADQDDIWAHDKLIRHVRLIKKNAVEGVSSNVLAFWPDGKTKLIDKAQPQRELDFLFESAGPGCTFLMTPWLAVEAKKLLNDASSVASDVALHDWLIYSVCRASGKEWLIDSTPSLHYRQHGKNVVGANSGLKAKLSRLKKISDGWYRAEVIKILSISYRLSNNPKLLSLLVLLKKTDLLSRLRLLQFVPQARRKMSDRFFLALMIITGLF